MCVSHAPKSARFAREFGDVYERYAAKTPAWFPRISALHKRSPDDDGKRPQLHLITVCHGITQ